MFNPDKRVMLDVDVTVGELIRELQKLPEDAHVSICGAYTGYIHVDDDEGVVIDCEPLYENYPEDAFDDEEDD